MDGWRNFTHSPFLFLTGEHGAISKRLETCCLEVHMAKASWGLDVRPYSSSVRVCTSYDQPPRRRKKNLSISWVGRRKVEGEESGK